MNSPETNDPIDKLLREQDAYVADNGFTKRVIGQLPKRRAFHSRLILLVLAVVGSALVIYWAPWKTLPPLDYTKVFSPDSRVLSAWLPFIVVIVALASAVAGAVRRED